ncbi:imidazolonepropionase [Chryseotalea sanaruensis]|uniref:Imidazolonepropionase n=1 Tax=Chryseotalea sanaruensis TaxID=2482724 RepID=A0A401UD84_9BACT|nr:imidazolonepropionase [Chryseotalea sanaruensis]GCC52865.1 imidazolonepropionase [Chryseotalea sanaruensis]
MICDLLLTNIKGLVQVRNADFTRASGKSMAELPVLTDAFLSIHQSKIISFGSMSSMPANLKSLQTIDCNGRFVFPSFVDSHTHLVFAASREEEFVMKINGATYQDIAAAGGGILNSARKLQTLAEDELLERSLPRAWEIIQSGTGAVEIKSGYGLTVKDEIKMLRVAKRIAQHTPLTVKTTFLGAHAVPANITKEAYIQTIIQEMIPAVAEEKLANYIDVFCEQGFFTPDETEKIVEAGKAFGMKPRLHANQLYNSGGVQVGVKTGALSVDHLENIGPEEIEALKKSAVMPTALPGAAFFLNLPFPLGRAMIEAGLPLAIASDYNPGSAPSGNMSLMMALACIKMKLTPEEAINAATINTADALELSATHGSITAGKQANIFITKPIPSYAFLPYAFGSQLVDKVILNGKVVSEM